MLALVIAAPLYAVFYWKSLKRTVAWNSLALSFIAFWRLPRQFSVTSSSIAEHYTSYEGAYLHQFWNAVRGAPSPNDIRYYVTGLWNCFFAAHFWPRLLFPDFLPIPLPYYWLLLPGFVLASLAEAF